MEILGYCPVIHDLESNHLKSKVFVYWKISLIVSVFTLLEDLFREV